MAASALNLIATTLLAEAWRRTASLELIMKEKKNGHDERQTSGWVTTEEGRYEEIVV